MTPGRAPRDQEISADTVVAVSDVSKTYKLYPSHQDRLKEALHPFRKRYHQEFSALRDVTFEIHRGESVGILGRNGAGKSTLLQLIAGVLSPTSGTIKVSGKIAALLELGAGFNPDLTGRENVVLASTIQGIANDAIPGHVAAVEAFADIGMFFDQPLKVYSSGMYARVAFANAINVNPDVLIVDEILGVGDAKFQEKCYSKIRSLREAGVCILFVSHSTEVIQRNCENAVLLEGGRVMMHGPADAAIAAYHDLLYGAQETENSTVAHARPTANATPSPSPSQSETVARDGELATFLRDGNQPVHRTKPYHNPNERRLGNREAEIVDFLVLVDGKPQFGPLTGQEALNIYIKVRFRRDVELPRVGWALATTEGIIIGGSNTVMQGKHLPSVCGGQTSIYRLELRPALCGGQYFITVGVGECPNQDWTYFDVRRSVIHIEVADSGHAAGFFHIPSSCENVDDLRG